MLARSPVSSDFKRLALADHCSIALDLRRHSYFRVFGATNGLNDIGKARTEDLRSRNVSRPSLMFESTPRLWTTHSARSTSNKVDRAATHDSLFTVRHRGASRITPATETQSEPVEMSIDASAQFSAKLPDRILEPMDRISEVLIGLIMALTFTLTLGVVTADTVQVRTMLLGALGCNLPWGIIDASVFLMARFNQRGRSFMQLRAMRA